MNEQEIIEDLLTKSKSSLDETNQISSCELKRISIFLGIGYAFLALVTLIADLEKNKNES